MSSLSFETGIKTFDINGDPERTISFNPSDFNFIHGLYTAYTELDALQKKYQLKVDKLDDGDVEKMLKTVHAADMEIRGIIDKAFEPGASEKAFGKQSTFAITTDGCPLWAGFLLAVMSVCDDTFTEREKAKNPKLEALLRKYRGKK